MAFFLFLGSMIGNSPGCQAQEKIVRTEHQQWVQYYNQTRISEQWTLVGNVGYRWRDGFDSRTLFIARAGAGYAILPGLNLTLGFTYASSYSDGTLNRVEFRPYQEVGFKQDFKAFSLNQRFMVEERFFNPVLDGQLQTPNSFNFRFRYLLLFEIPLFKLSRSDPEPYVFLAVGDEIFINAGSSVVHNVFDQNRLLVSPTLQWNKTWAVALTWNNQYGTGSQAGQFAHTQVLWLQIRHKLDFRTAQTHKL